MILAHNYQVPEIQDVAALRGRLARPLAPGRGRRRRRDRLLRRPLHGGDRLHPLSRQDRPAPRSRRRLLARRLDHRRRAARLEGPAPRRGRGDVREHHRRGQGRDRLLLHLVQRRRRWWSTSGASTARTPRSCSGPDMFLGAYVEKVTGRRMNVWTGECHVHAGIRPSDIAEVREANPGADFLIHPECGCSTLGDGVRGRGRRRRREHPHALHRRHAQARARVRGRHVHRRHRDRHAPPARGARTRTRRSCPPTARRCAST